MAGKMTLHKLVVLGEGGVGKTALTIQLCLNHFVETYDPTIEDSYRKQVVIDGSSCMLEVLDTAGQEEFTALRDQWIRDGEGFILVYAVNSRSSFTRIEKYITQIQRVKESSASSSLTYPGAPSGLAGLTETGVGAAPIMIVANKCDKVTDRAVSTQEGSALARHLGCDFVEASAKNRINVEKVFYDVVRSLRAARDPGRSERRSRGVGGHSSHRHRHHASKSGRDKKLGASKCVIL